jgi:hypothetical protein
MATERVAHFKSPKKLNQLKYLNYSPCSLIFQIQPDDRKSASINAGRDAEKIEAATAMINALEKIDLDIIGSPPFSNAIAKSGEVFAVMRAGAYR